VCIHFSGHDRGVGALSGFGPLCVCRRLHQYNPVIIFKKKINLKMYIVLHVLNSSVDRADVL